MIKFLLNSLIASVLGMFLVLFLVNSAEAIGTVDFNAKYKVMNVVEKLTEAANAHDIDSLASFYSNDFLNSDNFNKEQVLDLIESTWKKYPNISYTTDIKDVRVSEKWAAVELQELSKGSTQTTSLITGDLGELSSEVHSVLYLRKIGKDWKIVSDQINFERSALRYGTAKTLSVSFSAPEQVRASMMYSAKVGVEVPVGSFAVASITKEPIISPSLKHKEVFKNVDQSVGSLERVFTATDANNNEMVSATIGVTELTEDNQARPLVELKGIYIITSRVNVVPESSFDRDEYILVNKASLSKEEYDGDQSAINFRDQGEE